MIWFRHKRRDFCMTNRYRHLMSVAKIIAVVLLLLIGFHLLLYGYLKRRVADARRKQEMSD